MDELELNVKNAELSIQSKYLINMGIFTYRFSRVERTLQRLASRECLTEMALDNNNILKTIEKLPNQLLWQICLDQIDDVAKDKGKLTKNKKKFEKLNEKRHQILHGLWVGKAAGAALVTKKNFSSYKEGDYQKECYPTFLRDIKELEEINKHCQSLESSLVESMLVLAPNYKLSEPYNDLEKLGKFLLDLGHFIYDYSQLVMTVRAFASYTANCNLDRDLLYTVLETKDLKYIVEDYLKLLEQISKPNDRLSYVKSLKPEFKDINKRRDKIIHQSGFTDLADYVAESREKCREFHSKFMGDSKREYEWVPG